MKRIYFASKLEEASRWRALCETCKDIIAHARWLKHNKIGTPNGPEYAAKFWLEDEADIGTADAIIVFATDGQHLRGALVEAGMAIAMKKPVYVIGDHPDYGTWRYHPGVVRVKSIDEALRLIVD